MSLLALQSPQRQPLLQPERPDAVTAAPPSADPEGRHSDWPIHRFFEYGLLEQHRPEVASLARFAHGVDVAIFYLCVAFERGSIRFDPDVPPPRKRRGQAGWCLRLADETFQRFGVLRRALMVEWSPPAEVEPLTYTAFSSLCELAPAAGPSLKVLFFSRPAYAASRLVSQLDLVAKQIEEAVELADDVGAQVAHAVGEEDATRLAGAQAAILAAAGESLGLSEAAARLGTTRQNLHKRIVSGSALGVMRGRELVIPSAQFVETEGAPKLVPGLRAVSGAFREAHAGDWSLLQFLVEHDPCLGAAPMERLRAGDVGSVVAAARAFLGLDEG